MTQVLIIAPPPIRCCKPITLLAQVLLIVPPPIQCFKPITLLGASLTYFPSTYAVMQTHNIT